MRFSTNGCVVPAYPYEGALLYLMHRGKGLSDFARTSRYYRTLFGTRRGAYQKRAAALCSIFDDIYVAGADAWMPEDRRDGNVLRSDRLRLSMHMDRGEWCEEVRALLPRVLADRHVAARLDRLPRTLRDRDARGLFVSRIISQTILAYEKRASLVGDAVFTDLYDLIAPIVASELQFGGNAGPVGTRIAPEALETFMLNLVPESLDDFYAIRDDAAIREYGSGLVRLIEHGRSPFETRRESAQLLLDVHDRAAAHARVHGVLGVSATIGTIVGFSHPEAGIAGLATDLAARAMERATPRLPLLSTKMIETVSLARARRVRDGA